MSGITLFHERYLLNEDAAVPLYTTVKGTWYEVHTLYNYFVILCGFFLFIPMYWRSSRIVRKQIIVLIMGAAVPMLFNIFFWFGVNVDLTPFGFAVSGIVYVWGILRFNLLRFTPLALTQVFDTIRDGVILLDYEDQIVSYNSAAEGVFPELGLTKHYPAYVGEVLSASPELIERIRGASTGDERFPFQRSQANRSKHYHCSLSFICDSGTPIGKMLLLGDITELKDNEARLRENARQLSELNTFKDKLFTVVAHDIRDPIANLVSLTELLGEELAAAGVEHAEVFHGLQGQVQSTFQLVENLLDWYRNQKGKVVFRPLGWNLQQVVRQSLSLAGPKAGLKQIELTERIDEKHTVRADKEMLDLILRNLLSNAIKFTGIGGAIEIGAALEGDLIVVSIHDNGSGIDETTAEALRQDEPFFKMPVTGDDTGNTRFGLVLANEFVSIHGGSLWFDSVPGFGTIFSFTLPRSSGGDAFDDATEAKTRESHFGGR
jgi:signal transduction histidine kinase